jgi:hypothetical protein
MLRRIRWAAARRWASSRVPRQHTLLHRQRQCPPARTIQMESHGIAIPAPTHEAGAGHLPYAHPHALQACRAERYDRPGSTAPENLETSSWWHGGGMEEDGWEERERKKGEQGGNPVCWRRRNVGWYSPGVNVFIQAGALDTPNRRHAGRQERARRSSKGTSDPLLL